LLPKELSIIIFAYFWFTILMAQFLDSSLLTPAKADSLPAGELPEKEDCYLPNEKFSS
jgi:hypothetical protein